MSEQWDNDRAAVLAEDEAKAKAKSEKLAKTRRGREEYLANVTLKQLLDHAFFSRWQRYPPKKAVIASRRIMTDTVQALIELGPNAAETDRMALLEACIERFNSIDAKMDHFIETVEREDICEEFEAIVYACGLGAHEDLADEWRDWQCDG